MVKAREVCLSDPQEIYIHECQISRNDFELLIIQINRNVPGAVDEYNTLFGVGVKRICLAALIGL